MSDELRGDVLQTAVIEGTISNGGSVSGAMASTATLQGNVLQPAVIEATISDGGSISGAMASIATLQGNVNKSTPANYTGEYEVTPSDEMQTLPTTDKMLGHDIVVNPIPSNYGKITWDGHTLTVS